MCEASAGIPTEGPPNHAARDTAGDARTCTFDGRRTQLEVLPLCRARAVLVSRVSGRLILRLLALPVRQRLELSAEVRATGGQAAGASSKWQQPHGPPRQTGLGTGCRRLGEGQDQTNRRDQKVHAGTQHA